MNLRSTMKIGTLNFFIGVTILMTLSDVGAERIKLLPDSLLARGQKLVVGGRDAVHGEFPFQVSIQIFGVPEVEDGHICGGSILNENTVLTAAHCFDDPLPLRHFEIVAGNNKLKGPHEKGQRRKIDRVFVHSNYSSELQGSDEYVINDIALIRVRVPFIFNDFVNAVRLPEAGVYPAGDAQISGWGAMTKSRRVNRESAAETLQVAVLPLLSPVECEAAMEGGVVGKWARTLLCTNPSHGAGTPWKGDSGSPLSQGDVVIGIVSTGDYESRLVTYTRVSAFRKWIDSKLSGSSTQKEPPRDEF